MIRKACLTIAVLAFAGAVSAQEQINREVNVTRAYEPSVSEFLKLRINPDMTDTTQLHPEFNYEVTPRPLDYHLSMSQISPLSINTVDNRMSLPFYLKIGGGLPLQSTGYFSFSKQLSEVSRVGASLSHYGFYDKIENDQGYDAHAMQTFNSLNVFGGRKIGNDLDLSGELGYDYNNVTRYGYYNYGDPTPVIFDTTRKALEQYFNIVRGKVQVGNSFTDFSKLNFRVTAEGFYLADKFKYDMFRFKGRLELGYRAGEGANLRLRADVSANRGQNNLDDYSSEQIVAGLAYNFKNDYGFRIKLGVDVANNFSSLTRALPQLQIEQELFDGQMIPYAEVESWTSSNNPIHMLQRNPYVREGLHMPSSYTYDIRAGIKGHLFDVLKYKVYGGYTKIDNKYTFVNDYDVNHYGNVFTAVVDSVTTWRVGAELEVSLWNSLDLYGNVQYHPYESDSYQFVGDEPDFETTLGARYNYRKKLFLSVDATIYGERFFYQERYNELSMVKAKSMVDVSFGADYFVNKQFGIFCKVNNLLNQDLYRFNHYPLMGINATAGVKLSF